MIYYATRPARRQVGQILAYGKRQFGSEAAQRHRTLIGAAMTDVAADPARPGSKVVADRPGVRVYPLAHSRNRVPIELRVGNAAHKLIYTVTEEGAVLILAVVGLSYPAERAVPKS